ALAGKLALIATYVADASPLWPPGGQMDWWAPSGSLRRTDVQEPLNAVVTSAYGFSFVLPYLFYPFRSSFQIILDHFPKLYYPSTIMSSLVTKWKKNKPYLYWVRSARVQGKPRIVEQIYLGPRERVLEQLRTQGSVVSQPGAAPPLRTVLARLLPAASEELSSQPFWDHMHLFEEHHFAPIQQELFTRIRQRFPLGEQFLVYDTTNYYTFIHTFNSRPRLPQRGRNTQKR